MEAVRAQSHKFDERISIESNQANLAEFGQIKRSVTFAETKIRFA
jgi:hypothetical protein